MAINDQKKRPMALNLTPVRTSSSGSSSSESSLGKPLRTPRFAEATTVHSPIETRGKLPFSTRDQSVVAQSQPGDIGFGYINDPANRESTTVPMTPRSPLKSAMRVPGTPARKLENPLSPTFREEQVLEKRESDTEKEQVKDLTIKTRVRMAKFALRGVNFSCSLIILAMLSTSFSIFNATKSLAAQSTLPAWADNTQTWPQIVVLSAACLSLAICVLVFIAYVRGGHRRAEKVGVYYTMFAVGWFVFSMILWAVAAGVLQFTRNNSNNKDMWGWSCVENHRSTIFSEKVDYALICRLQNWTLICIIIEIVVEVISITLYSVVFYRYYTKRKLTKSMDLRDKARSDLYLAQLRSQSAPNTPGFGPKSPAFSQYALSPRFPPAAYRSLGDIEENAASPFTPGGKRLVEPQSSFSPPQSATSDKPFKLQAPPVKAPSATKLGSPGFRSPTTPTSPEEKAAPEASVQAHAPVAPGEIQYDAVPIPGAYADQAVKSPPPTKTSFR
jgi:hypothetical protein